MGYLEPISPIGGEVDEMKSLYDLLSEMAVFPLLRRRYSGKMIFSNYFIDFFHKTPKLFCKLIFKSKIYFGKRLTNWLNVIQFISSFLRFFCDFEIR
jgi:hypothetical protein